MFRELLPLRRAVMLLLALAAPQAFAQSSDFEVLDTDVFRLVNGVCTGPPVANDSTCVRVTFRNNGPDLFFGVPIVNNYMINLSGGQVVPPSGSPATGMGSFTLSGDMLSFNFSFSGLMGMETATHIRGPAAAGQNAPILFTLPLGSPKMGMAGPLEECAIRELSAGLWYVSIQSTTVPTGEIRGQITPGTLKAAGGGGRVGITVDIDDPTKPRFVRSAIATTSQFFCFVDTVAVGDTATALLFGFSPTRVGTHNSTTTAEAGAGVTDPSDTNDSIERQFIVHAGSTSVPTARAWAVVTIALLVVLVATRRRLMRRRS